MTAAMIFAAGIGSRLRPLTDTTPKALIEVGGMTMLERTIRRVADAGTDRIVINVHHHAPLIRDFLERKGYFGLPIALSDESDRLLDTGGGLLRALPLLADADNVILHNADILTDIPLRDLLAKHSAAAADATLAVMTRPSSRQLLFSADGLMRGWTNSATGETRPTGVDLAGTTPMAFCGVHIVTLPALAPALRSYAESAGAAFSLTPFYIQACSNLAIRACDCTGRQWVDIGRPETLALARAMTAD